MIIQDADRIPTKTLLSRHRKTLKLGSLKNGFEDVKAA